MEITASALFNAYDRTVELVKQHPALAADFANVQRQFDDKRRQPDASIMVYGVYNAGKSTLINALIGDNVAKTGDIPLTDSVDAYSWGNIRIFDTPGVDAPLAHEQVTREQMLAADAIIFVVNPSGAAEEEKTLQVLVNILQAKKKLFLVLNDKDNMDIEVLTRLKNDIRIRLQTLAEARGMQEVLHDIPILRVNAEMALKAKLANKSGLLQVSEFPAFETALTTFIAGIDTQHINRRLAAMLYQFLDGVLQSLDKQTTSETVRSFDALIKSIVEQQYTCRKTLMAEIKRQSEEMYYGSKAALRQGAGNAQQKIEAIFNQACERIDTLQRQEIEYLVTRFKRDLDHLETVIWEQAKTHQDVPHMPEEQVYQDTERTDEPNAINADMVSNAVTTLGSLAKPEHIVSGLKLVKEWAPSLMKGIGTKTMEKWGAAVIGKWIPYVGPAVTVIGSLWDIFAEDSETKRAREQSEQYRREWERYQQEVEDFARTTAAQFESSAIRQMNSSLDPWFKTLLEELNASRDIASQQDRAISDTVLATQQLASELKAYA